MFGLKERRRERHAGLKAVVFATITEVLTREERQALATALKKLDERGIRVLVEVPRP